MIDVPVRVRDALKSGSYKNNYRIVVLDSNGDEDFTIDNNNLISESVKLDERMCSDDNLKFGLCEGTNVEFQYFDFPNITNRKIKIYIDVNYRDADKTLQIYSIPMGWFDIKECSRQADTGIIKASGYNKLLSDYLDLKVNDKISSLPEDGASSNMVSVYSLLNELLEGYSISSYKIISQYVAGSPTTGSYYADPNVTYDGGWYMGTSTNSVDFYLSANKTYVISGLKKYKDYLFRCMESLKSALASRHGSTAWNKFITSYAYYFATTAVQLSSGSMTTASYSFYTDRKVSKSKSNIIACSELNDTIYVTTNAASGIYVCFPASLTENKNSDSTTFWHNPYLDEAAAAYADIVVCEVEVPPIEKITVNKTTLPDVTLRELQSATFELAAQYGKLDRVTDLFSGVNLNGSRLYPSDTLYPASDLYPMSQSERADKAMYSNLWGDEGNVRSFRNLIITYKDSETNKNVTITKVVNADGTDDYAMDDNWLFKNLAWSSSQVDTYANAMVTAMQNVRWFPFQMWCAGLPYIETGDEIEVSVGGSTYPTYVLTRTLSGIQDLQDTYANGTLNIF